MVFKVIFFFILIDQKIHTDLLFYRDKNGKYTGMGGEVYHREVDTSLASFTATFGIYGI